MKKKPRNQGGTHGGARPGSGRPPGISTKIIERQSHASELLGKMGGDTTWMWALSEAKKKKDYRTVAEIMKYWTDRAEGKAAQAVIPQNEDGTPYQMTVNVIAGRASADS